jgi:hypothetical protein
MPVATLGIAASAIVTTPPPIPTTGLMWWFDADDASTITQSAGLVSKWVDKSGNGQHATSGGGLRPTYALDGLKAGRGSVVFAGAQRMDVPSGVNQKPFSILVALKHTNLAAYRSIVGGPSTGGLEWRLSNVHKLNPLKNNVADMGSSSLAVPANAAAVITMTYSATGLIGMQINGSGVGSYVNDQSFNGASDTVYVGDAIGEPLTGTIGEIVKYNRVLTTTELADVNSYLSTKWK